MTTTLLLQASDIRDNAHWYWRLQDADGDFLADHTVAFDPSAWQYKTLLDLPDYLNRRLDPARRRADELPLLDQLGAWIGEQILGPIAPALLAQAPITVRIQIPTSPPAALELYELPLELAHAGGKPLPLQGVRMESEIGQPDLKRLPQTGDRPQLLILLSMHTGDGIHGLRHQRRRLGKLIRQLTEAGGCLVDLGVPQIKAIEEAWAAQSADRDAPPAVTEDERQPPDAASKTDEFDTLLLTAWRDGGQHVLERRPADTGWWITLYVLEHQPGEQPPVALEHIAGQAVDAPTVSQFLPLLERAAEITQDTELEPLTSGVLAGALQQLDRDSEAIQQLRDVCATATRRQAFRLAAATAGELVALLQRNNRFADSLAEMPRMQEYTRRAGLGRWTQLADEALRLRLLHRLDRHEQILSAVEKLAPELRTLPDTSDQEEWVTPFNVRETLLGQGLQAANALEQWESALAMNDALVQSLIQRGASLVEQTRIRCNDYHSLLKLGREAEVRHLLEECRAVFADQNTVFDLGRVYSAMAHLEYELGHIDRAIDREQTALRYWYLTDAFEDCANSHGQLSFYLSKADTEPAVILAHRLAAALILCQVTGGRFMSTLQNLIFRLVEFAGTPSMSPDFAALCEFLERKESLHFRELFERLPQNCAASGDEVFRKVLNLMDFAQKSRGLIEHYRSQD